MARKRVRFIHFREFGGGLKNQSINNLVFWKNMENVGNQREKFFIMRMEKLFLF